MLDRIIKTIQTTDKLFTVLLIGDSSLSTEWVHPNWRSIIEYVIKNELELSLNDWQLPYFRLRFINAGLNGADTRDFLKLIPTDIKMFKPSLVIFMGGDNDIPILLESEETTKNLNAIRKILSEEVELFVFSTGPQTLDNEHNKKIAAYMRRVEEQQVFPNEVSINLLREFDLRKIDLDEIYTFRLSEEDAKFGNLPAGSIDKFHPNRLGQAYIASILLEKVFKIPFDPVKYLQTLDMGEKYPQYR